MPENPESSLIPQWLQKLGRDVFMAGFAWYLMTSVVGELRETRIQHQAFAKQAHDDFSKREDGNRHQLERLGEAVHELTTELRKAKPDGS